MLAPLKIQMQSVPVELLCSKRIHTLLSVLLLQTLCNSLHSTDDTGMGGIICNEGTLAKKNNVLKRQKK